MLGTFYNLFIVSCCKIIRIFAFFNALFFMSMIIYADLYTTKCLWNRKVLILLPL